MTTTTNLTSTDLDRMANDDRWLGFGYIGGRVNALTSTDPEAPAQPEQVALADALALDMANAAGMDYDRFFEWANSKDARWFADCALGCDDLTMARRYGPA